MGVVARDFGVHVTDIPGFSTSGVPQTDCGLSKAIGIGDNVTPMTMFRIDAAFERFSLQQNGTC